MNQNASEITPSASITVEAPHPRARALRAAGLLYFGDHRCRPEITEVGDDAYLVTAEGATPMLFRAADRVTVH